MTRDRQADEPQPEHDPNATARLDVSEILGGGGAPDSPETPVTAEVPQVGETPQGEEIPAGDTDGGDEPFPPVLSRSEQRAQRRRRMLRRRRTTILVLIVVLLVGGAGAFALTTGRDMVEQLTGSGDFEGEGSGEVVVTVHEGTSLTEIANQLVDAGVIKSSRPFIKEAERRELVIQATDYTLRTGMSSEAAVEAFITPIGAAKLAVPEGFRVEQIRARMIEQGFPEDEVADALDDHVPSDYGLEVDAPSLEGYLYPATYTIRPGMDAQQMVQAMVDRTGEEIDDLGIPHERVNEVFTLASLVQVESPGDNEVRAKVARVFLNRVDEGMRLQSDATVAYYAGARDDLTTTAEERDSDNPYNTYKHEGLPPGPVNSPGRESVDAAENPADGPWLYFVAIDPDTGETAFAETYDDHLENVEIYREWLREHGESAEDGE
ncbi:endolytic transglycosylase MltG [Brevibacterium samyangense]|uniref:Endolytic murein transglycosylase n=1 Tax=Brevibacterium samyangense TaxID=366888 RepID=A0ABP5EZR5_9MICO